MDRGFLLVNLGRSAPHHDQAGDVFGSSKRFDVGHHLLGQIHLALARLDVGGLELLDVALIEHRGPRRHRFEKRLESGEVLVVKDSGLLGRDVGVVGETVPAREFNVLEFGEGNKVPDQRGPFVGALSEADGSGLGHAAYGLDEAGADRLHAGDKRGRHRPHPGEKNAQFALCGRDRPAFA